MNGEIIAQCIPVLALSKDPGHFRGYKADKRYCEDNYIKFKTNCLINIQLLASATVLSVGYFPEIIFQRVCVCVYALFPWNNIPALCNSHESWGSSKQHTIAVDYIQSWFNVSQGHKRITLLPLVEIQNKHDTNWEKKFLSLIFCQHRITFHSNLQEIQHHSLCFRLSLWPQANIQAVLNFINQCRLRMPVLIAIMKELDWKALK